MSIGLNRYGYGVLRLVKPGEYLYWCPGCKTGHTFDVHALSQDGHVLGFDGDFQRPSVSEIIRIESIGAVCEHAIRGGQLRYTRDCTHALAGQILPMVEYPLP